MICPCLVMLKTPLSYYLRSFDGLLCLIVKILYYVNAKSIKLDRKAAKPTGKNLGQVFNFRSGCARL
jgi:hypothetical protein